MADRRHVGGGAAIPGAGPRLDGPAKVAALLLAVDRPVAARLLQRLSPEEIREVTRAAAELGSLPATALEHLVEEFASHFSMGADLVGSAGDAEQLLSSALPAEQVSDIMADVFGGSNRSLWDRLSAVPDGVLAAHLSQEHPQTIALVLSKVATTCAANVLARLPGELKTEVARRMLEPKPVADPVMRILESQLHEDLLVKSPRAVGPARYARMAEILNKMDREQMENVLREIEATRPETAVALRSLLFGFEDIPRLTSKARMVLFEKLPSDRLILALKGAEAPFREAALSALTARARRMVEQELDNGQMPSAKDIKAARRALTDLALDLASRGEIELFAEESEAAA